MNKTNDFHDKRGRMTFIFVLLVPFVFFGFLVLSGSEEFFRNFFLSERVSRIGAFFPWLPAKAGETLFFYKAYFFHLTLILAMPAQLPVLIFYVFKWRRRWVNVVEHFSSFRRANRIFLLTFFLGPLQSLFFWGAFISTSRSYFLTNYEFHSEIGMILFVGGGSAFFLASLAMLPIFVVCFISIFHKPKKRGF